MIFVKMGENPSGITITKNNYISLMISICFTTCVSSKSDLGGQDVSFIKPRIQGS